MNEELVLGEDIQDWCTELCDKCEMMGYEYAIDEEYDNKHLKWLCVGEIIRPENPKDLHEEYNQIRICILKSYEPFKVTAHEWTPWEASRVIVGLSSAISNTIVGDQPKQLYKEGNLKDESV